MRSFKHVFVALFCLLALDAQAQDALKVKWKYKTKGKVKSNIVRSADVLLSTDDEGYLYALDRITGKLKWKYKSASFHGIETTPVVSGETVIAVCYDEVIAFDLQTGSEKWKNKYGSYGKDNPWAGLHTFFFAEGKNLHALDVNTGKEIWVFTDRVAAGNPVVTGDFVLLTAYEDFVALNKNTGKLIWRVSMGGQTQDPAVFGETVYFGCNATRYFTMYALDIQTGRRIWEFSVGNFIMAAPDVANGEVYFGSADSFFYALNFQTGELNWKQKTGAPIIASPFAFRSYVAFGSYDGCLYIYDIVAKEVKWKYQTRDRIQTRPFVYNSPRDEPGFDYHAIFVDFDVAYVTSFDGYIYALEKK